MSEPHEEVRKVPKNQLLSIKNFKPGSLILIKEVELKKDN